MGVNFQNHQTKKRAVECIRIIHKCADEVGIRHALFVNFGLLLGIVREKNFIGHDNDVDMCIQADKITPQQELDYFNCLQENEFFYAREKESYRPDPNGFDPIILNSKKMLSSDKIRLTWFSLRKRYNYPKFCHWFVFPWNGYYWHTKAGAWVKDEKFKIDKWKYDINNTCAIMKGIPQNYLDKLTKINFYGININIPLNTGTCLDFYYPGWLITKTTGSSSKKIICLIKNWQNQNSWKVKIA